jgi:hypothetical protein
MINGLNMAQKTDSKIPFDQDEEGSQTGEGGQGGVAGEIRFRYKDAMSIAPRDDALPLHEVNRLLAVHKDLHKAYIDKQKQTRKERKQLKEGRASLTSREGLVVRRANNTLSVTEHNSVALIVKFLVCQQKIWQKQMKINVMNYKIAMNCVIKMLLNLIRNRDPINYAITC